MFCAGLRATIENRWRETVAVLMASVGCVVEHTFECLVFCQILGWRCQRKAGRRHEVTQVLEDLQIGGAVEDVGEGRRCLGGAEGKPLSISEGGGLLPGPR